MPFFAATLVTTSSIVLSTSPQVVMVGTLMSIVTLHFCGVTLWLEPPVISVRLQLIDLALFSAAPTRPTSHLSSWQAMARSHARSRLHRMSAVVQACLCTQQ